MTAYPVLIRTLLAIALLTGLNDQAAAASSELGLRVIGRSLQPEKTAGVELHRLRIEPEWSKLSDQLEWHASARIEWRSNGSFGVSREQPARASYNRRVHFDEHVSVELRELFLRAPVGPLFLQAGKQQLVWGQADGFRVLDLINPMSFDAFILEPFEDARIPTWMVKLDGFIGTLGFELVAVLDPTANEFVTDEVPFRLEGDRFRLPPSALTKTERPPGGINGADFGLRLRHSSSNSDLGLIAYRRHSKTPVIQLALGGQGFRGQYLRETTLGATLSHTFRQWVLRAELAHTQDRAFTAADPSCGCVLISDVAETVIGLDWFGPRGWFASAQWFWNRRLDDVAAADPRRSDQFATLALRKALQNERWVLSLDALHNTTDHDWLLRPRIAFEASDRMTWALGADLFRGTRQGLFGQLQDESRIYFELKWEVAR